MDHFWEDMIVIDSKTGEVLNHPRDNYQCPSLLCCKFKIIKIEPTENKVYIEFTEIGGLK